MSGEEPDAGRVQENAQRRQHDRTERVERVLRDADKLLGKHKYPTTSEELATEYGDEQLDLPNETESLGSVFDRLVEERYESAEEAREAFYNELTGTANDDREYNDQRDLEELDDSLTDDTVDSNVDT